MSVDIPFWGGILSVGVFTVGIVGGLAWLGGRVFRPTPLPDLLGMVLGGGLAANGVLPLLLGESAAAHSDPSGVGGPIRTVVLAVVLLRAGLGLSGREVRRAGRLALGLGFLPVLGDALAVAVAAVLLLGWTWAPAMVLGFLVAAISPAIVIPGMLEILGRRVGAARRLPVALLAGAPFDNLVAVVAMGVALDVAMAARPSWWVVGLHLGWTVVGGVILGLVAGIGLATGLGRVRTGLAPWILWAAGVLLVLVCQALEVSFVIGLLVLGGGVRSRAAALHPGLDRGLKRIWSGAQVFLFGFIGAAVHLESVAGIGLVAVGIIAAGQVGRLLVTLGVTRVAGLRRRERWGVVCAYLPKATIQAAFAGYALDRGLAWGQTVLAIGVLSVVIMAPLGMVALHRGTEKLLPRGGGTPNGGAPGGRLPSTPAGRNLGPPRTPLEDAG